LPMNEERPERSALLFMSLVAGLSQAAFQQLGKLQNPFTGKIERDLEAARTTIDTLAALESRTRGNLSGDETTMLERTLTELRLNYVDEVKKAKATESKPSPAPAGEAAEIPASANPTSETSPPSSAQPSESESPAPPPSSPS